MLDSIQGHDDQMQVFMHEIVEDLREKVVSCNVSLTEHCIDIKTEEINLKRLAKSCVISITSNVKKADDLCIYCRDSVCSC